MKVLCTCAVGLGNYLMSYPAFSLLRDAMPGVELHLLALRHSMAAIARNDPMWRTIQVIDPTKSAALGERFAFLRSLAAQKFDVSLSFFPSNNWQYNLLPLLCGVRERVAFRYALKRVASLSFLNTRFVDVDPDAHDVEQNVRLAAAVAGRGPSSSKLEFPELTTAEGDARAARLLAELDAPRPFVAIHPGCSMEHGMAHKRWDPVRFGRLANKIARELGGGALIFGGPEEEPLKRAVASALEVPCRVVAATDLATTAAVLRKASVMLANDSGLMHLAACLGVPTIGLFGPSDERRNGPMGQGHLVVRKPMPGFPLWNAANVGVRNLKSGVDPEASLKALSVEDAWQQVKPWLSRSRPVRNQLMSAPPP